MRGRWGSRRIQFDFKKFIKSYFERIDLSAVKTLKHQKSDFEVADSGGNKKIEDLDYTDIGGIWTMESTTQFSKKPSGPAGQAQYLSPGSYTWTAPAGVTSVCVVCVGGGGGGLYYNSSSSTYTYTMNGGGGGGLGWTNNIDVTPGQSYPVEVGAGGITGVYPTGSTAGGVSYFIGNTISVSGNGGQPGRYNSSVSGGGYTGFGGGAGGSGVNTTSGSTGPLGGGGAGGYNGPGYGMSSATAATNTGNEDGGAVGDFSSTFTSNGGGGTGLWGTSFGSKPSFTDRGIGAYTGGGSSFGAQGGFPGGGGGGSSSIYYGMGGNGGDGAIRIIWGPGRSFPDNAEDV